MGTKHLILVSLLLSFLFPAVILAADNCLDCHGQKGMPGFVDKKSFSESSHGMFACSQCHLNMPAYPHGKTAKVNCGICHFLGTSGAPREQAQEYKLSVHGRVCAIGDSKAPACQTCHGSHSIYPSGDLRSATRRQNIPALCAKCHPIEAEAYGKSVHGRALAVKLAPTCFDCHLEHLTPPTADDQWKLSLIKQCGNCHQEQISTYRKTYHGKVTRLGYAAAAKCSDCHGSHSIMRVSDRDSLLSEQNILATCRKCHPHATKGFTSFYAHAEETNRRKYPVMFYTFVFMTLLLIGTFAFFLTHTFLWTYRSLKERMSKKGGS